MKLYVDMDGVLSNFEKGCKDIFDWPNKELGKEDISSFLGLTKRDFWKKIDSYGEKWWAELEQEEWFDELLEVINFYDSNWKILSSPSRSPYAASGKILWLQKRFGHDFKRFHITPAKNKCDLANRQSVLIDDNDDNCREFREKLGYSVLFPTKRNNNINFDDQKIEYVKNQLHLIKLAI